MRKPTLHFASFFCLGSSWRIPLLPLLLPFFSFPFRSIFMALISSSSFSSATSVSGGREKGEEFLPSHHYLTTRLFPHLSANAVSPSSDPPSSLLPTFFYEMRELLSLPPPCIYTVYTYICGRGLDGWLEMPFSFALPPPPFYTFFVSICYMGDGEREREKERALLS